MKLTRGVQVFDFVKVERTKIKMGNMNVIKVEYRDRNEIKIANGKFNIINQLRQEEN